jgi:hypothetical protein
MKTKAQRDQPFTLGLSYWSMTNQSFNILDAQWNDLNTFKRKKTKTMVQGLLGLLMLWLHDEMTTLLLKDKKL